MIDQKQIDPLTLRLSACVAESLCCIWNSLMTFASYEAKLCPDIVLEAILLFILQLHAIHAKTVEPWTSERLQDA